MDASEHGTDTGLACLLILARFFGIPADARQLRHAFARPGGTFGDAELLRAARALGLKARAADSTWDRLQGLASPAIAACRDGRYRVVGRADSARILVQDPSSARPAALEKDAFLSLWTGRLILVTRRVGLGVEGRKFDFSWFVPAIVRHRRLLGEVLLASLFVQVFALLTPLFFQVVIDKVLVHHALTTLHVLAVGMLALAVFEAALGFLRTYVFSHTSSRIDLLLGMQLFRHLLRLPLAYFEARRVGATAARVQELETIRQFLTGSTLTAAIDLLFTVVFLAVMVLYSPLLTLVVAGSLPLYAALSAAVTPVLRKRLHEKFNRGAENQAFLVESVNGIGTVKAMALEPLMQIHWEERLADYVGAAFRAGHIGNAAAHAASLINKITTLLVLWIGAHLVIQGELSIGQLIAFNMLAARVSAPVLRIVQLWHEFQQAGISMQRLGDILNASPEPAHAPGRVAPPRIAGDIVFDRVRFRYQSNGPDVLRGISFTIRPGEVIGIVGPSGSGKSTLGKLIQRLYIPDSGQVRIDGLELVHVDPAWLRSQIGVVLQETFLFNRSVRDNIAVTDPGMPLSRIIHAARLAGAHDFIVRLPQGYDTIVGEHGCSLSGGQRQRIAIARTLITNPRILIFDEATSALDYESEQAVQQNMAKICAERTVIIIAHRLTALRYATRIFVIEDGVITEQGSHDELIRLGGYYARLYRHQVQTDAVA